MLYCTADLAENAKTKNKNKNKKTARPSETERGEDFTRQSVPHEGLACILCQLACWIQNLPPTTTTTTAAAAAAAAATTTTLHLASSLYGRNIIPYLFRLVGRRSHCKTILMLRHWRWGHWVLSKWCAWLCGNTRTPFQKNIKPFWEMLYVQSKHGFVFFEMVCALFFWFCVFWNGVHVFLLVLCFLKCCARVFLLVLRLH